LFQVRFQALSLLEEQSQAGVIDLFDGDEASVSEEGYVPYGCGRPLPQFKDEAVHIEVAKGQRLNCFALISRQNQVPYTTTPSSITAAFVVEQLDKFSWQLTKPTVVVQRPYSYRLPSPTTTQPLAPTRLIPILSAALQSTLELGRTTLERAESPLDTAAGLPQQEYFVLCRLVSLGSGGK
jgi:hypothetical protein